MKNLISSLDINFINSRKLEYKITNSRNVYNKLHKEIHSGCSHCRWHKGENKTYDKWYGLKSFWRASTHKIIRYPSWKLVSKNMNQYDYKPITRFVRTDIISGREYMEIKF